MCCRHRNRKMHRSPTLIPGVDRSTVVHFFGCPGAGKSTIANTLLAFLREGGQHCYSSRDVRTLFPRPTITEILLRLHTYRADTWKSMFLALSLTPTAPLIYRAERAFGVSYDVTALKKLLSHDPCAFIILDQWLLGRIWKDCRRHSLRPSVAKRLIAHFDGIFRPVYFYFAIDIPVVVERLYHRGLERKVGQGDGAKSPYDTMTRRDISRALNGAAEDYLCIRDTLCAIGGKVITVDATRSVDEVCQIVYGNCVPRLG